jgi:hypothetical protein
MELPPGWVIVLMIFSVIAVIYLLPKPVSKAVVSALIRNDAATIIGAMGAIFGFLAIVYTVYQINVDLADRTDERIERQRNTLLRTSAGNDGKGEAITSLFERGVSIDGLDLSCRAIGGWSITTNACERPVLFGGIRLESDTMRGVAFTSMRDAVLLFPRFRNIDFVNVDLSDVTVTGGYFAFTNLSGNLDRLSLRDCFFWASAIFSPGARLSRCDVSGAELPWLDIQKPEDWEELFAWADLPPRRYLEPSAWNADAESEWGPLPPRFLSRMILCAPPRDEFGNPIAPAKRDAIRLDRPDFRLVPGVNYGAPCEPIEYEIAARQFPQSYVFRRYP